MPSSAVDEAAEAALAASRALVGVAVRSLAAVEGDVTLPQYRALVLLAVRGPHNVGALADALDVQPSSMTGLCDRLVAKGLVIRKPSTASRREVTVSISARGRALVNAVASRRVRELRRIFSTLDAPQLRRIVDAFASFARAAGELPDDAWRVGWT
jgi:DNA-binding MarR family transcriptional regulator